MRLTGLSMLQIQDSDGQILSSGHFRNEHGRIEPGLASALSGAGPVALVAARGAGARIHAPWRASSHSSSAAARSPWSAVSSVDEAFLGRLARDRTITVSLHYPGGALSTVTPGTDAANESAVGELQVPVIRTGTGAPPEMVQARLEVTQPLTPLRTLLRSADSWFLLTAAGTGLTALLLAVWVSSRISRPLAALAEKTAVLDLDRLDVDFDSGTDEVGRLSRLLGDLAARLRTSTARVREAERRATVGELARQINHDIKNGLIPLRNVMRHLAQVERDDPRALARGVRRTPANRRLQPRVSRDAGHQLSAAVAAGGPARLRRERADHRRRPGAQGHEQVEFATDLANVPRVVGDPVALRRILENLTANAVDSLASKRGRITVSTRAVEREREPALIRVIVADTGRGMSAEESKRIFDDFYTTKEGGTGLGLSIVRRLVMDLGGTIGVESAAGQGTRMIVDIPAGGQARQ